MRFGLLAALCLLATNSSAALDDDAKDEKVDGTWIAKTAELGGKKFPEAVTKSITLMLKDDQYTVTVGKNPDRGTCKRNPAAKPKTLDITGTEGPNKGRTILAIYERKDDTLKVCYDLTGKKYPEGFKTADGTQLFLVEYQLKKE